MKNRKNYYAVKMKESRERRGLVKKSSRKKLTKEKSRIKMREKYGNEEWKRQHALERAAQRKAQKT